MNLIETTRWRKYRVGDLFDIRPTKAYNLTNSKLLDHGTVPVVVNSAYNNGIGGYSTLNATEKGQMITFSDTVDTNTIFYQANDFIGYPHVQGLYPIGEFAECWNEERLLFFASVFRKAAFTKGFDYGNKFRRDIAIDLIIKLPVNDRKTPDWDFMDKKISMLKARLNTEIPIYIHAIKNIYNKKKNIRNWGKFHLYDDDLFVIDSGTKLDRIKMTSNNPSINFVGRANANNGVTDFIDKIDGIKPYDAGCMTISLGGEYLGSCFVQESPFYTSQNVNVLIPKHPMSDYAKRFIATMVFKEGRLHYKAFIDELNRHMKTDFTILLPIDSKNRPDWDYMENYMRRVEEKTQSVIQNLQYHNNI